MAATATIDEIGRRLERVIPPLEWPIHAFDLEELWALKRLRRAVVLAHNYQTPEIFHGAADFTGDSLALAQQAAATDAEVIVLCGVHFMAETAKLLNPEKTVLIPDLEAGCSLAASITAGDVRRLREAHPGVPVVTYVNTSAAVKAESDVCCTSSNAVEVVESLGVPRVILIPDEYLANWVATQTSVEIVPWRGRCEVHERFGAEDVREFRAMVPGVHVLAHPECSAEVLAEADFVGSTSGMIAEVARSGAKRVALVTECSMSDNVSVGFPDVEFVRPCNLCPHMKRITLPKIVRSLREMREPVEIDPRIAAPARRAVERMVEVGRGAGG
jgi:quinolinate synthase